MTNKFPLLALGAMLGLGACSLSAADASAGALPLFPSAGGQVDTVSDGVIQVAQGKMRSNWEERRDGRRCSRSEGNCRHFHGGFYYETPWWTLPLIIGGNLGYDNGHGRLSCGEARSKVLHSGFRNVSTIECNGTTYTFKARRGDHRVIVYVNSRSGAVWRG
jgi:hypothetical protein